jgi:medium-chain acyl-[acyl-carrier-protein] hydrolase
VDDLAVDTPLKPWTLFARRVPTARVRLLCFPFAGGGASAYRAWPDALAPEVEVWPVQLPGRENRLSEPAARDLGALAETLAGVFAPHLTGPYALFGHSMGAMVAFELARRLRVEGGPEPVHLFVSAHAAPQLPVHLPVHDLPPHLFLEVLRAYNGTASSVLEHSELLQLLLPNLRADFALFETYRYREEAPLQCPLSVLGGVDDSSVPVERLRPWERHTTGRSRLRMLPGNHFFLQSASSLVIRAIREDLRAGETPAAGGPGVAP